MNQHKLLNDYKLKLNDEDKLAKIGKWFEQLDIKTKSANAICLIKKNVKPSFSKWNVNHGKNKLREFVTLILDRKY